MQRMELASQNTGTTAGRVSATKRHILTSLCLAALTVTSAPTLQAQTVPTGFQEYFVLGHEQHMWDLMDKVVFGQGGGPLAAGMNSVVTATASAANQVIYYDHWEDGFEADLLNPVQASTMVIGDGNPANGDACDFNAAACGTDLLNQGDFVNFSSNQGLGAGCTVPSVAPGTFTELCSSVPVNNRCVVAGACTPAEVRFDGGDLILTSGGPLSIVHSQDPLTQFIGGSTEMLSRQAVEAARSYSVPVGEDLYVANTQWEPFHYVDLDLVAFEDNTQVFVDSPGAGTVSFTLNRGQHWSSLGYIDDGAQDLSIALTINAGTKVSTSAPITGLLFTGGDGQWATRHYALLPDILHSTDYVITAPGDDPTTGPSVNNRPLDIYILNPDPFNAITVNTVDSVGTSTINIPANSVTSYLQATGRAVPVDSTVRLTSNRNFWGISAYDYDTNISDWGHSWLATRFLTENYTVSFAPGDLTASNNLNAIYVAATQDNTSVQFDLDGDGVADVVDLDGVGGPDGAGPFIIDALESLVVYDPGDFDNTGTRILANKPVAVAWGQETDLTGFGDTALDTGYTVYPTNQLFLDPVLTIDKTTDTTAVPTAGGLVTYTLTVQSYDFGSLTNLQIYDVLPAGVLAADYVPGSTLITYPNLTQSTADPVGSVDPLTGRDRLDWALSPDTMNTNETITVRYTIQIPPAASPGVLVNVGHAIGVIGGSTFHPVATAEVVQTDILFTKNASTATTAGGDVITFTLNVSNGGVAAETNVTISDPIPVDTTFNPGSITTSGPFAGSYDPGQNAVVWTANPFPVGGPHALSFSVTVNPTTPSGTVIRNRGGYESDQTPYFLSNEVDPVVVAPDLIVSKSGPGLLHPNEVGTYAITVRNDGGAAANNVLVVDNIPPNTTYVAGSMDWRLNALPFTTLTDVADSDEGTATASLVTFQLASLGPGQDITFRFRFRVDPGTAGQFVNNQASVRSDEVPPQDTNLVQSPVVGDGDVTGHVFLDLDGDGTQDPGEPDLANVDVAVTDAAGNTQIVTTDSNGDWLATVSVACYTDQVPTIGYSGSSGNLNWTTSWLEDDDDGNFATGDVQAVVDPLGVLGNSLRLNGDPVSNLRALHRQVDVNSFGTATLSFDYRRSSLESADIVDIEVSYDGGAFQNLGSIGNGTDATWQSQSYPLTPGLPASQLVIRFRTNNFNFVNDEFFFDNVSVCTAGVTADVVDTDPDIPNGATLSTANDPQSVDAVIGGTVATTPVGYEPRELTVTKTSDPPGHEVTPGQRITYTITVTNNTAQTQTGVSVTDPLPSGTVAVPGSTQVIAAAQPFRVTEYYLGAGTFSGTSYDLTLNQDLAADYFVMLHGSDGDGSGGNDRGPDENYAALTADPFGTGDLATSASTDVITLTRDNAVNSWVGVVTVVESIASSGTAGFSLLDVQRVAHTGGGTSGSDTSGTAWSDINQVMLMGGFNGAGCDTAETSVANTNVCHARLFPSGSDQINWTRNAGGATLSTATSTVMVLEWGSDWTVQRARVQGTNGGDGLNATGEYNTASISAVSRANTWVWGAGHTDDNGIGDSGEGVVITLGDGVNATGDEVAVGTEYGGTAVDFEVWALTHTDLAVAHTFVNDGGGSDPDGDSGDLIVNVTVPSAGAQRMGLAFNSQNGTGTAYPRPFFSTRYFDSTTLRMERRRSGQPFAAWTQGIDFTSVGAVGSFTGGDPANLVVPSDGVTIAPGESITVTFQVDVQDPLALGVTQIVNVVSVATVEQPGPFTDSVTDNVVRPSVVVEPNNAGYLLAGASRIYSHNVVNTSTISDSYAITGGSELGWPVQLLDPGTGAVIAEDQNGDGVWDGGVTVNTGTLPPGGFVEYLVRVTAPGGTPLGTEDTTRLTATSDRSTSVSAAATDETTVLDGVPAGQVVLTPDNSGIVQANGSIAYSHVVINNTGAPDTIDLLAETWDINASPAVQWPPTTIHWDTNGDGVYTDGVDLQITNTAQLPDGGNQLIFVVVTAPAAANAGDLGVSYLTAVSRNDPTIFGAATDTTTVFVNPEHDLSGGGSRVVAPGDISIHPGTIVNLGTVDDDFNLTISPSNLYGVDGLLHPTHLWVDTNGDGVPDTQIASDLDGDGTWDVVDPAFDTDTDGDPDIPVTAGGLTAYELRRPVDLNQQIQRDHVTLNTQSINFPSAEPDNVTATWIFAAVTRAAVRGVKVDRDGLVGFVTASQVKTAAFKLYETNDRRGRKGRKPLHSDRILSPVPDSLNPILYTVATRPITKKFIMIKEFETDGDVLWKGPFKVGDPRLSQAFDVIEGMMDRAGIPRAPVRWNRDMRPLELFQDSEGAHARRLQKEMQKRLRKLRKRARLTASGVKIEVREGGPVEIPTAELEAAGLPRLRAGQRVYLTHRGLPARFHWKRGAGSSWSLAFDAVPLSTDYSDTNVYVVTVGGIPRISASGLTVSGNPPVHGFRRVERNVLYIPSLPEGPDPWQWDLLFSGAPWPDPAWDPTAGDFDLPRLAPGATGEVPVRIRVAGYTEHTHTVTASINGLTVGSVSFDGAREATLEGTILAESLLAHGNSLSVTYVGTDLPGSTSADPPMAYLDYLDIAIPEVAPATPVAYDLVPWVPTLPSLTGVEYLIVTHPDFRAEADRLAALKSAEGLQAAVVDTDVAYDRFSGGIVEPEAIRTLIRRTWASGQLRHVVLFGDDSFDPRDYVGVGSQSFVPSLYGRDATWGRVPSETGFADADGDGRLDVAIARLPVQTVAEAQAVVDKIATQAQTLGALLGAQLAVVDNASDTDSPFREDAEGALALLPDGPVRWADLSQGSTVARDAILQGWAEGAMLTHFFGHGGPMEWADERILTHQDIDAHGADWKPTVLLTWACLSQWHVGIFGTSVNEALLLQPGGGAVASFGPAGITPPSRQAVLVAFLYQELGQPGVTLGEAIRRAKNAAIEHDPNAREVIEGFNLFGDPALVLPWAPAAE